MLFPASLLTEYCWRWSSQRFRTRYMVLRRRFATGKGHEKRKEGKWKGDGPGVSGRRWREETDLHPEKEENSALYVQETEWRGSIEYGKGKGGEAALNMAGLIRLWNIVYCCIKGRILI